MPTYEYRCVRCGIIEIFHAMSESNKTVCPDCNEGELTKQISACGGIIMAGREANQYSDIRQAKYWRDKNGVKHLVTSADGHTGSATVTKQTATAAMIKERKRCDDKQSKKKRLKIQEKVAIERVKRNRNK